MLYFFLLSINHYNYAKQMKVLKSNNKHTLEKSAIKF